MYEEDTEIVSFKFGSFQLTQRKNIIHCVVRLSPSIVLFIDTCFVYIFSISFLFDDGWSDSLVYSTDSLYACKHLRWPLQQESACVCAPDVTNVHQRPSKWKKCYSDRSHTSYDIHTKGKYMHTCTCMTWCDMLM